MHILQFDDDLLTSLPVEGCERQEAAGKTKCVRRKTTYRTHTHRHVACPITVYQVPGNTQGSKATHTLVKLFFSRMCVVAPKGIIQYRYLGAFWMLCS